MSKQPPTPKGWKIENRIPKKGEMAYGLFSGMWMLFVRASNERAREMHGYKYAFKTRTK